MQRNLNVLAVEFVQQGFRQFVVDAVDLMALVKVIVMRFARVAVTQDYDDLALAPWLYVEVNANGTLVFNHLPGQVNGGIEILVNARKDKAIYRSGNRCIRKLAERFEGVFGIFGIG